MPVEHPKPAAPYLPWKTFLNSFDVFSQGVPPRIHRTLWRQSGLMQGLLLGAYRFLGLINDEDRPTAILARLADTTQETRPAIVAEMLKASYPEIMAHGLAIMTIPILSEMMEKYNVSGSTKKKAITFFLQAAKYGNLPLSNFIRLRSSGPRRRRSRVGDEIENGTMVTRTTEGEKKIVELNSGGTVTLIVAADFLSLNETDRKFVFELVDKMKGYVPSLTRTVQRLTQVSQATEVMK